MDRRRLQQSALLWALSALLPSVARSQSRTSGDLDGPPPRPPPMLRPEDPTIEQASLGLRSMLEVAVHDALEKSPTPDALAWTPRLRSAWNQGDWLTDPNRRNASPWLRFEHFEEVANLALRRCWPQSGPHLMLLVHHLHDGDLREILIDTQRRPEGGHWATVQLERRMNGRVHNRLLGEVVQVQLEWLKAHQDRYPQRPTPREAQVEMEHFEACQRITRAIVDTVFLAIALQEQRWRGVPLPDINVPSQMATMVALLGPPPERLPFGVRERPKWPVVAGLILPSPDKATEPNPPTSKSRRKRR